MPTDSTSTVYHRSSGINRASVDEEGSHGCIADLVGETTQLLQDVRLLTRPEKKSVDSLSYISRLATSQGFDSDLLLSTASLRGTLWTNRGTIGLQLTTVFNTNMQTITTQGSTFYSATEYRKYDRFLQFTFGFRVNDTGKKVKTTKTKYGEKDF